VLKAWGDESKSSFRLDPGAYIFGAIITNGSKSESDARDSLRGLLLPGQKKPHWRDESDKRRDQIIEVLSDCSIGGIVVTRVGNLNERDERRRRKCFELFALQLIQHDVWELTLESRGATGNALDMEMVRALGASAVLPTSFRLSHAAGSSDPLLWAADAVCGALVANRIGKSRWLSRIERVVQFQYMDVGA